MMTEIWTKQLTKFMVTIFLSVPETWFSTFREQTRCHCDANLRLILNQLFKQDIWATAEEIQSQCSQERGRVKQAVAQKHYVFDSDPQLEGIARPLSA